MSLMSCLNVRDAAEARASGKGDERTKEDAVTVVRCFSDLKRPLLSGLQKRMDRNQKKRERKCYFSRPLGHHWDHPHGDKRATYDGGVEGPAIGAIRTCKGCGRREKQLTTNESHTDYTWCRLNPYQE